jgi:hypothetical protein
MEQEKDVRGPRRISMTAGAKKKVAGGWREAGDLSLERWCTVHTGRN